ncbi:MAG: autotransporter-associated beta strand repeat-containing protein [Pirellulales bacterium]
MAVVLPPNFATAATYTWTPTAAGTSYSWIQTSNWTPAGFPDAVGDVAELTNNIVGAQTISLNQIVTLGTLNIGDSNGSHAFTLAAGTGGLMILDAVSGSASINKIAGTGVNDLISAGGLFYDPLTVSNASTGSLTLSGTYYSTLSSMTFNATSTGAIVSSGGLATAGDLIKTGTGTLSLTTAAKTYAGSTLIKNGTVIVGFANAIPLWSPGVVLGDSVGNTAGILQLGTSSAAFAQTLTSLTTAGTGASAVVGGFTTASALTLNIAGGVNNVYAGRFGGLGTNNNLLSLVKTGSGTLTLTSALTGSGSTYTGSTTFNAGTVHLDFSATNAPATNILGSTSAPTFNGGTLKITGKASATVSQTLNNLTLGAGGSTIEMVGAGAGSNTNLVLGTFTATTAGGTLLVKSSANTSVTTTTTLPASGIYGAGRAVFFDGTNYNWLTTTTSTPFVFSGLASGSYTALPTTGVTSTSGNFSITGGQTQVAAASSIGTLRIQSSTGSAASFDLASFDLTLNQNGLLFQGSDAYSIDGTLGGRLIGGTDLIIHQYGTHADGLTINAGLSGTANLVKTGSGLLTLGLGANNLSGGVFVNAGTLSFRDVNAAAAGSLGNGSTTAVSLGDGATLRYTGATGAISGAATTLGAHTFVLLGGNSNIEVTNSLSALTLSGVISQASGAIGGFTKLGPGTLILNAVETYTGATIVNEGTLQIAAADRIDNSSALIVGSNGTFDFAAGNETVGSIAGSGLITTGLGTTARTFTVGNDNTSTTFTGTFGGTLASAFVKNGTGVLTLAPTAPMPWTGNKVLASGTIVFGSTNALGSGGTGFVSNAAGPALLNMNGFGYSPAALQFYGTGAAITSQGTLLTGAAALTLTGTLTVGNSNNPLGAVIDATGGSITMTAPRAFTVNDSTSVALNEAELTIIGDIIGAGGGITKSGTGNMRLTAGTNTTTGTNTFSGGITFLDYTTSNTAKLGSGNLAFGASSGLVLLGNTSAATLQTVGSLTLTLGSSSLTLTPGAAQNVALSFTTITCAAGGGLLRINLPTGTQSSTNGVRTTQANDANGMLSSAITVTDSSGVTTFATNLNGNIVGLASTAQDNLALWPAGQHVTDSAGFTGTLNSIGIATLRFNAAAASTVTIGAGHVLNLTSGGVLQTSAAVGGTSLITGGTLLLGTGNDLIATVDSASQRLEIASTLPRSARVTIGGAGTVRLSGNNNFTGNVTLNSGTLQAFGGNAIGDTATVSFSATASTVFEISGNEVIGILTAGGINYGNFVTEIRLTSGSLTFNDTTATNRTYSGILTGTGALIRNGASGAGNFLINVAQPNFGGTVVINGGMFYLEGNGTLGNATAITVNKGGAFVISNSSSTRTATRIADTTPITLNSADGAWQGATVPSGLSTRTDQNTTIAETIGDLIFNTGASYMRGDASGTTGFASLVVNNFVRNNNATVTPRGRAMGATTGDRNQFRIGVTANENAFMATLIGGGGAVGSKNISIIPWMLGETTTATLADTNMGNSLVTYMNNANAVGLRALDLATEYNTFATKATATDNIRESLTAGLTNIAGQTINALVLNNANTATSSLAVSGAGAGAALTVTSGAFLFTAVGGTNAADYAFTLGGFNAGINVGSSNEYVFFVQRPAAVANAATMTATISSSLASTADITKSGRGTLILSAVNTAGGGARKTTLNEGTLQITDLDNIGGNTGGLVFAGGTLQLATGFADDLSTRTISFLLAGGTIDTGSLSLNLANNFGTGSGGLTKVGAGSLTYSGIAGYTGATAVQNGRIILAGGADNRLNAAGALILGTGTGSGVLQLGDAVGNASSVTVSELSTSGTGTANAIVGGGTAVSVLTVNQSTTTTYGGVIGGAGANENNVGLVKTGTGTLILGGTSTFTGGLAIRGGTVIANNVAGTLGDATNVVSLGDTSGAADATLLLQSSQTYANPLQVVAGGTGAYSLIGGVTTEAPVYSGAITLANRLFIGKQGTTGAFTVSGGITGTGNLVLSNMATTGALLLSGGALNYTGTLSHFGSATATTLISSSIGANVTDVVQNSTTTPLTLSGTSIGYVGATIVNSGTLNITGSAAAPLTTTGVIVAGGGTLNLLNGVGQAVNLGTGAEPWCGDGPDDAGLRTRLRFGVRPNRDECDRRDGRNRAIQPGRDLRVSSRQFHAAECRRRTKRRYV